MSKTPEEILADIEADSKIDQTNLDGELTRIPYLQGKWMKVYIGLNKELRKAIDELAKKQGNKIKVVYVSHEKFKEQTKACRAVVRTGEATPYANIIFHSGVTF